MGGTGYNTMVHLREKPRDEYTGLEAYLQRKIGARLAWGSSAIPACHCRPLPAVDRHRLGIYAV